MLSSNNIGDKHCERTLRVQKELFVIHKGRNKEGLTWAEWRLATRIEGEEPPRAFQAWQDGEDPAEWAADHEEHRRQRDIDPNLKEFVYALCQEEPNGIDYNVVMPVEWKPFDRAAFPKLLLHTRWGLYHLKVGESALLSTIHQPQKQTFYAVRRTK